MLKRLFADFDPNILPTYFLPLRYIRAYLGRAASQVIYAGKVLFADFEST